MSRGKRDAAVTRDKEGAGCVGAFLVDRQRLARGRAARLSCGPTEPSPAQGMPDGLGSEARQARLRHRVVVTGWPALSRTNAVERPTTPPPMITLSVSMALSFAECSDKVGQLVPIRAKLA